MDKKVIFAFIGGAVVGGAAAWFIARDYYIHDFEIPVEEWEEESTVNPLPRPEKEDKPEEEFKPAKLESYPHSGAVLKEDLEALAEKYRAKHWDNPDTWRMPENLDDWELGDAPPPNDHEPADKAYQITEEDFSESRLDYDKVTLYYHFGDNTVIEEGVPYEEFDQKMMEDAIGSEIIDMLKKSKDEIIFVRNERLGIDYQIIREEGSYGKDVLGLTDE